jgi:hypothetical protein
MQNKFFVLIVALAGLFFNSSAQNLGIQPTTLNFTLGKGQAETQVINISNSSPKKVQYRVYLNDWLRDSMGGHMYFRADTLPRSCARWISVNKNFIELQPGQSAQLTVKMQVPDSAEAVNGMRWAMLFIETVEEQLASKSKQAQATVHNLLRLGVHIYQTPPTITDKQVKILDLKPARDMANTYQLVCQNTGGVMLECKSYLEVTATDGKKFKLTPVEFPLFPDQRRNVTFELPKNLPKAKYSVLAVVDGGEDMSLEALESQVEVK